MLPFNILGFPLIPTRHFIKCQTTQSHSSHILEIVLKFPQLALRLLYEHRILVKSLSRCYTVQAATFVLRFYAPTKIFVHDFALAAVAFLVQEITICVI